MRAILERDFLSESSRPRMVVLRTVVAALIAAAVVIAAGTSSADFRSHPDQVGRVLFWTGSGTLLATLVLLAPPMVVGSVLAERQQETLPLVLASPVGPHGFAAAKLLSRAGVVLLLAIAALPSLVLTTTFGGVSTGQVLDLVTLCVAVTLELTAWSVWYSTASRRLATAAVLSFLVPMARWTAVILLFAMTMRGGVSPFLEPIFLPFTAAVETTPMFGLIETMTPGEVRSVASYLGVSAPAGSLRELLLLHPAQVYLCFAMLAAAVGAWAAGRRLTTECEPKGSVLATTKFGRRWFRGGGPRGNPVTWKERRLLNTAGSRGLFYSVMALLVLSGILGIGSVTESRPFLLLLAGQVGLLCLVCTVNGAAVLGQERTQGSYDLLRASLLTPGEILRGKAAGVWTALGLLGAIPVLLVVFATTVGTMGAFTAAAAVLLILLVPWGWAALGMATATHAPRMRTAVVRTMAAFAACLVGLPALAGVLDWIDLVSDKVAGFIANGSPPVAFYNALRWIESPRYDLVFSNLNSNAYYFARERDIQRFGLAWTLLYLGLSAWLTLTLRRRLVRVLDRDRD